MEYFPEDRFPSGKAFFGGGYVENYTQVNFPNIVVVHNNFIRGHAKKKLRFQIYRLWDVGAAVFPRCRP